MRLGELIRIEITNIVKGVLKSSNIRNPKLCKVIGVSAANGDTMTCDVETLDTGILIEDVRLTADNNYYGFVLVPSNGSIVEVSFNTDTDAFLSMVSQIDKIYLNGNNKGGLVEVQSLVTKLNNLEINVNDILTALDGITVTIPSGGGTVPFAPFFAAINPLTPTVRGDIENTNVEHGTGNLI